jgi:hypothetical protein
MLLHLGGSPSLPNNRVHIGIYKAMEMKLVGRRHGILATIHEFPNNIIVRILLQINIVGKKPKLHKLSKMLQGEGGLQIYFSDPTV